MFTVDSDQSLLDSCIAVTPANYKAPTMDDIFFITERILFTNPYDLEEPIEAIFDSLSGMVEFYIKELDTCLLGIIELLDKDIELVIFENRYYVIDIT